MLFQLILLSGHNTALPYIVLVLTCLAESIAVQFVEIISLLMLVSECL
jgi:hypothetical protein